MCSLMQTSGKSQLLTKVTKLYPGEYAIDAKDDRCLHGSVLSPDSLRGRVVLQTQAGKFFFFFLAVPCGLWYLSSLTSDQTCAPCSGSLES